jgi:small subunit ribosomal protein S6e
MPIFKFVISEPTTKKSFQLEADQGKAAGLIGKKIGEEFSGDLIGLNGYSLKITGGTDKDGFPMHPSVKGPGRKRVLLAEPPGFHPKIKGQRRRKTVRGDTISEDLMQINVKVVKKGDKPLEEIAPSKPKEAKPETKPAEKKEEKKAEEKKPEKKEEAKPAEKIEEKPKEEKKEGEGSKAQ